MPTTPILRPAREPLDREGFFAWVVVAFQSSVLDDVWGQITFYTLFATMVACVHLLTDRSVAVNNAALGILSGLLGFVVSLRTSSAYERYCEGRKVWSMIFQHTRIFAQCVWLHVRVDRPPEPVDAVDTQAEKMLSEEEITVKDLLEKKTILNLLQAYSIAIKHHCRAESGVFYDDLYPLVSFLPKYAFPSAVISSGQGHPELLPLWQGSHSSGHRFLPSTPTASRLPTEADCSGSSSTDLSVKFEEKVPKPSSRPILPARRTSTMLDLLPSRNPNNRTLSDHVPIIKWVKQAFFVFFCCSMREKKHDEERGNKQYEHDRNRLQSNIPLEIALFLSSYVGSADRRKLLDGPALAQLYGALNGLQDSLTALERLMSTALPFAYKLHLHMTVYLFLITLPFQIVQPLGWLSIPATFLTSFFYLGFLMIGKEIENPFGYDKNDLDLDLFCSLITKEIAEICSHPRFEPEQYIFEANNTPFAMSGDLRSANDILKSCASGHASDKQETLKSVQNSLSSHFRHASNLATKTASRQYRHAAKKAPRKKIEVEYAD